MNENHSNSDDIQQGSNRSFGLVFAGVFFLIGLFPLINSGPIRWWSLITGGVFGSFALLWPSALALPNRLWFRFGLLLQKATHPLILGILFYGVITPIGLLMRLTGKDFLRLKLDPAASTYWIHRDPPGPLPETMKDKF